MDLFACPPPTSLASIPTLACPIRWDQVQKFGVRRISGKSALTATNILLLATLTPLLSATDNTKLLITCFLNDVKFVPGEVLTEGGNDNTTLNGIPKFNGLGFSSVTGQIVNASAAQTKALRALTAESLGSSGGTNLEIIPFNKDGKVIASNPSGSVVEGFPIYNFAVADVGSEGFGKDNINAFSFSLAPGWSENHVMYKPTDYNPLTLVNS